MPTHHLAETRDIRKGKEGLLCDRFFFLLLLGVAGPAGPGPDGTRPWRRARGGAGLVACGGHVVATASWLRREAHGEGGEMWGAGIKFELFRLTAKSRALPAALPEAFHSTSPVGMACRVCRLPGHRLSFPLSWAPTFRGLAASGCGKWKERQRTAFGRQSGPTSTVAPEAFCLRSFFRSFALVLGGPRFGTSSRPSGARVLRGVQPDLGEGQGRGGDAGERSSALSRWDVP